MKTNFKKGIAMIELIFALVIMGITLMSVPMIISQSANSNSVTFQQESIAILATHTSALLTYAWDENNTNDAFGVRFNVLRVPQPISSDTDIELDINLTSPAYRGTDTLRFKNGRSRLFTTAGTIWTATQRIGVDTNDTVDDIDDFVENTLSTSTASTTSNAVNEGEYMDTTITITNRVNYVNDQTNYSLKIIGRPNFNTTENITNIKWLTTRLNSKVDDKQIIMQAFMCNIGTPIIRQDTF